MKESTRMLVPEEEKCIGCRACTSACPEKLITFSEEGNMRSISFPANCGTGCELCELCELCALACPENAISFIFPEGESENVEKQTLDFELVSCQKCGTPFATIRELEKVRTAISEKVPLPPRGDFWVELCPGCRQEVFRERQAEALIRERTV